MARNLADETLSQILEYSLYLDDDLFADTFEISPFAFWTHSSSEILLVCRRWARIGTPHLYEAVVLRTSAQARALAAALQCYPHFGRFVRRLRLEGIYSKVIASISRMAPAITDFCFAPQGHGGEPVTGLCKALQILRPRRIILGFWVWNHMWNTEQLDDALASHIESSDALEEFVFSDSPDPPLFVVESLAKCTSLRTVRNLLPGGWIRFPQPGAEATLSLLPNQALKLLATNTNISYISTRFHLFGVHERRDIARLTTLDEVSPIFAPGTQLEMVYTWPAGIGQKWATLPVFQVQNDATFALAGVPDDVKRAILSQCIDLALPHNPYYWRYGSRLESWGELMGVCTKGWVDGRYIDVPTASVLLRVSKIFYELTLERLAQHLVFCCPRHLSILTAIFTRYPILPTRTVSIHSVPCPDRDGDLAWDDSELADLLARMPNLTTITSENAPTYLPNRTWLHLPSTLLDIVPRIVGAHLESMHLRLEDECSVSLNILAGLVALKSLIWDAPYVDIDDEIELQLAALTELRVVDCHPSFFSAFARVTLPELREAEIPGCYNDGCDEFLQRHGQRLLTVGFNGVEIHSWQKTISSWTPARLQMCPAVVTLTLEGLTDAQARVFVREGHANVHHLIVSMYLERDYDRGSGEQSYWAPWRPFLLEISREHFPSLRIITVRNCNKWPTIERDVKQSFWPAMATALAAMGIQMYDGEGRVWRLRSDGTQRISRRRAAKTATLISL
ncbi:hypothetical protein EXIGLDRAFT_297817 [Exidia glandulosa HHB12029]|uniref:Uncharacterized protein n=1 Tax=Exidia glandulosa HHB12029 TaxID=1314781 RepID=A0A165DAL8_EXIGL|nr:hypothetical protein EXIGLDRAFT_297817 [Exidia glandulosa HHB12029]